MIRKRAPKSCWNDTCYTFIITRELILLWRIECGRLLCCAFSCPLQKLPHTFLWNLSWGLQWDKKDSQDLWCYQETRHCQKSSCTTSWERNLYAEIWRRVPLKLWPAWIHASEKHVQSFHCVQIWKWAKLIFNLSRFSRWQAKRTGSQTQPQLLPFFQARGQGHLCNSIWN